jgi:hypothetical protein
LRLAREQVDQQSKRSYVVPTVQVVWSKASGSVAAGLRDRAVGGANVAVMGHDGAVRFARLRAHRGLALGVVAALLALVVFGVLWQRDSDQRAGQDALRRTEQVARSGRAVTAAELTDKPFDRLVVVSGLADADEIRRAVGTDWRRADELGYHCCEPAPIWVFVDDDEVVAFFRASSGMSYGEHVPDGSYEPNARLALSEPRRRGA